MDRLVKKDEAQFLASLEESIGPFLRSDARNKDVPTRDLKEPVIPIAKIYQAALDADAVAAELNIKDASTLRAMIGANPRLRTLGLADLLKDGGAINRAEWGSVEKGVSAYQQVSLEINRGTPAVFFRDEE
jgi:serine/threonine-protein kinase